MNMETDFAQNHFIAEIYVCILYKETFSVPILKYPSWDNSVQSQRELEFDTDLTKSLDGNNAFLRDIFFKFLVFQSGVTSGAFAPNDD